MFNVWRSLIMLLGKEGEYWLPLTRDALMWEVWLQIHSDSPYWRVSDPRIGEPYRFTLS